MLLLKTIVTVKIWKKLFEKESFKFLFIVTDSKVFSALFVIVWLGLFQGGVKMGIGRPSKSWLLPYLKFSVELCVPIRTYNLSRWNCPLTLTVKKIQSYLIISPGWGKHPLFCFFVMALLFPYTNYMNCAKNIQ